MVLTYHNLSIKSDNFKNADRMKAYIEYMFKNHNMKIEYDSVTNPAEVIAEILPEPDIGELPGLTAPTTSDIAIEIWKDLHGV